MKLIIAWILAVLITLFAAYYQRRTGPTYPKREQITLNDSTYKIKFVRSNGQSDANVLLQVPKDVTGFIYYKRYPSSDVWTTQPFLVSDLGLNVSLPMQPPAGKLEYYVKLFQNDDIVFDNSSTPVIIRYKGDVPAAVLIPHILFMFIAMLLSNLSGILGVFKEKAHRLYGRITLALLFLGGGILGPIVQKYAFGELWTGVPFGWDLTDNKTLFALIFWVAAVVFNIKKDRPYLTVIATFVLLSIYSIPHSLFGSQLDTDTGEVIQGFVINFFSLF